MWKLSIVYNCLFFYLIFYFILLIAKWYTIFTETQHFLLHLSSNTEAKYQPSVSSCALCVWRSEALQRGDSFPKHSSAMVRIYWNLITFSYFSIFELTCKLENMNAWGRKGLLTVSRTRFMGTAPPPQPIPAISVGRTFPPPGSSGSLRGGSSSDLLSTMS